MNDKYIPSNKNRLMRREDILPAERIFRVVQEYFDVTRNHLLTKSKKIEFAYPRQICVYFLDKYSYHNRSGIAVLFGWTDSNSVAGAIQALGNYLATDERVRSQVSEIEKILKPCSQDMNCI